LKISDSTILKFAAETFDIEARSILNLKSLLDNNFTKATRLIYECKGRVIITGIGKSAIIAQKVVATLNSTGTPSVFMHAADAIHGDLGMIRKEDVVVCISKSGESAEIKVLVPLLKNIGNLLIAVVGKRKSFLALQSDLTRAKFDKASFIHHSAGELSLAHSFSVPLEFIRCI